jgi:hypothetical protein
MPSCLRGGVRSAREGDWHPPSGFWLRGLSKHLAGADPSGGIEFAPGPCPTRHRARTSRVRSPLPRPRVGRARGQWTEYIAALSVAAALLPEDLQRYTLLASATLLIIAFLYSALIVFHITIRFVYFVDRIGFRHLPGIRHLRRYISLLSPKPTYAHNPILVPATLKEKIVEVLSGYGEGAWENRDELDPKALAVAVEHQGQGNSLLAQLASAFLKQGFTVQYLTASRHPIEFVEYLKRFFERNGMAWEDYRKKIVVIDAYSPHFAFLDSIYQKKDRELRTLDVTTVGSQKTYAGMHSASSRAFKLIQKQLKDEYRKPTLVIYEDTYALTDLESPEQYRIFVRHVMPSERMWDAMFTVFLESTQPESDWKMLQAYASMRLDLRSDAANERPKPNTRQSDNHGRS